MDTQGYGGRGAIEYGNPASVLAGVLKTDPEKKPADGWNKPQVINTPFGKRSYSGAMVLKCGDCGKDIHPVPSNRIYACTCP